MNFNEKYEYVENKPISSGSFGNLYLIRDKKLRTEYVLKEIRKEDPKNLNVLGTDQTTFENEINFLIDVKGTNIINIIDIYPNKDDKYYYIILEKMDGDLSKMLNKFKNGMSSNLIRKIFLQLNTGLKEMIKKGKVHRDLKPSNILYSYTNDIKTDFVIKIGDFGLAKDLVSTKPGSNAGTDLFKAPEVEDGEFSNKCDLYSLGIILYMLKTGEYIFDGKKMLEILINKNANKIKKETDDKILNDLIKKLVVRDPHKRIDWDDYFKHPFFKEKVLECKEIEENKIKEESEKKLKNESDIVSEALDETIFNGKRDKAGKYDKLVYIAMLAEQCSFYGDMFFSLQKLIKKQNGKLNCDERNSFSIACKNYFSKYRVAIRTIKNKENIEKKKVVSEFLNYILEYKNLAISKGEKVCSSIANFIKENLLPNANDSESKTFYLKMIADYNRYIAEFYDNKNNIYIKNAEIFYEKGLTEAKNLNFKNPINLGLTLNYTYFLNANVNQKDKALQISEECLKNGRNALIGEDEKNDEIKDCISILNLIQENIDDWKSEK